MINLRRRIVVDAFGAGFNYSDKEIKQMFKKKISKKMIDEMNEIKSWRYDFGCTAIAIKRVKGRVYYYYNFMEILKLPKSDLQKLSTMKMINIGMFPHGRDFEKF